MRTILAQIRLQSGLGLYCLSRIPLTQQMQNKIKFVVNGASSINEYTILTHLGESDTVVV